MSTSTPQPQRVELWIRTFAPQTTSEPRARAVECLERLESHAVLDEVTLEVWGKRFERTPLDERVPALARIHDRLERFEAWATAPNRHLDPFFTRRRLDSAITGECREYWHLPSLALAEYDGDGLTHVAPCRRGGQTVTVFDRLEQLADRTESPTGSDDSQATPSPNRSRDLEPPRPR